MTAALRVLIVDDEPLALDRLRFALRDLPDVDIIGEAGDGIEAIEKLRVFQPDLVILDIQMPGRTGLSVAQEINRGGTTHVVFVTAFEQFAPDAFDVEAIDYLIKPVRIDRLQRAIDRVRRRRQPVAVNVATVEKKECQLQTILVPDRRGDYRIPVETIDWIEAAKDYVIIHTRTRGHMVRMTMAELEDRLSADVMLRIHRSAFVRRSAIRDLRKVSGGGMTLIMEDETELTVGPSYMRTVAQQLRNLNMVSRD